MRSLTGRPPTSVAGGILRAHGVTVSEVAALAGVSVKKASDVLMGRWRDRHGVLAAAQTLLPANQRVALADAVDAALAAAPVPRNTRRPVRVVVPGRVVRVDRRLWDRLAIVANRQGADPDHVVDVAIRRHLRDMGVSA